MNFGSFHMRMLCLPLLSVLAFLFQETTAVSTLKFCEVFSTFNRWLPSDLELPGYSGHSSSVVTNRPEWGDSIVGGLNMNDDDYEDYIICNSVLKDSTPSGLGGRCWVIATSADPDAITVLNTIDPSSAQWAGEVISTIYTFFGTSVADLGDQNGDGRVDVAFGSPGEGSAVTYDYYGWVHLVYFGDNGDFTTYGLLGRGIGNLEAALAGQTAITTISWFGKAVTGVEDMDNDGINDLFVTCRHDNQPGLVLIHLNELGMDPVKSAIMYSDTSTEQFTLDLGSPIFLSLFDMSQQVNEFLESEVQVYPGTVSTPADTTTLLMGCNLYNGGAGAIVMGEFSKLDNAWTNLTVILAPTNAAESFGRSILVAGDLDENGVQDVLVGAPTYDADTTDNIATNNGCVYLLLLDKDYVTISWKRVLSSHDGHWAHYDFTFDIGAPDTGLGWALSKSSFNTETADLYFFVTAANKYSQSSNLYLDDFGEWLRVPVLPTPPGCGFACASSPCAADAVCVAVEEVFECLCKPGQAGEFCEGVDRLLYGSCEQTGNVTKISSVHINDFQGANEYFGTYIVNIGDVNGDSVVDMLVGAPSTGHGGAYGVLLNADLTVLTSIRIDPDELGIPTYDYSYFGRSAARIGDVNNDGVDDLAIGEVAQHSGKVHVLLMSDLSTFTVSSVTSTQNPSSTYAYPRFGESMVPLGDLDGDTYLDLAVGAPQCSDGGSQRGAVFILFLDNTGTMLSYTKISSFAGFQDDTLFQTTLGTNTWFGVSMTAYDYLLDGQVDLVIAANGVNKAPYVFMCTLLSTGECDVLKRILLPDASYSDSATGIDNVGDLDGNGVEDLIMTAHQAASFPVDQSLYFPNYAKNEYQKPVMALLVYLNADFTIASSRRIDAAYPGDSVLTFPFEIAEDDLAYGIAFLGDIDGDGIPNIALGFQQDDDGFSNAGAVYLMPLFHCDCTNTGNAGAYCDVPCDPVYGNPTGSKLQCAGTMQFCGKEAPVYKLSNDFGSPSGLRNYHSTSNGNAPFMGVGVANIGDLNSDGYDDLAVGMRSHETFYSSVGILFLNDAGIILDSTSNTRHDPVTKLDLTKYEVMFCLTNLGDVNGDGVTDLAGGFSENMVLIWYLNTEGVIVGADRVFGTSVQGLTPTMSSATDFGFSVEGIGDVNGDNVPDLAVGGPGDPTDNAGSVYIFMLKSSHTGNVTETWTKIEYDSPSGFVYPGDENVLGGNAHFFGQAMTAVGDWNSDSIPDLIVTEADPYRQQASNRDSSIGAMYLLTLASDGRVESITRTPHPAPTSHQTNWGSSVVAMGDVDGNGVTDLAVGAWSANELPHFTVQQIHQATMGEVWLLFMNLDFSISHFRRISATDGNFPWAMETHAAFGAKLAFLGDSNGDGYGELIVTGTVGDIFSSPYRRGYLHIVPVFDCECGACYAACASSPCEHRGYCTSTETDFTCDCTDTGYTGATCDIPVGFAAPTMDTPAYKINFESGTADAMPNLADGSEIGEFATSIEYLGDFDNDGLPEFAISDVEYALDGLDSGVVYIVDLDPFTGQFVSLKSEYVPDTTTRNFGSSIVNLGADLYAGNDNVADLATSLILAVSAAGDACAGTCGSNRYGAVYITYYNPSDWAGTVVEYDVILDPYNLATADEFGHSIADLGDLDGDNVLDLAVAQMKFNADDGAVYIYFLMTTDIHPGVVHKPTFEVLTRTIHGFSNSPALITDRFLEKGSLGSGVSATQDWDQDGIQDLLVGSSRHLFNTASIAKGAVYLCMLNSDGTVHDLKMLTGTGYTGFGINVLDVGDLNNDNIPELFVAVKNGRESLDADPSQTNEILILYMSADFVPFKETRLGMSASNFPFHMSAYFIPFPTTYSNIEFGRDMLVMRNFTGPNEHYVLVGAPLDNSYNIYRQGALYMFPLEDVTDCSGTGYWGDQCQYDYDDCASQPCMYNGVCVDNGAWQCNCTGTGKTGSFCEIDLLDCLSSPCENGGTCLEAEPKGYACVCFAGYEGEVCSRDIDDCASSPCVNDGVCMDELREFTCDCTDTGYEGLTCSEDVDDCASSPCLHDAVCSDLGNQQFTCACASGYEGEFCQTEIDECASSPCLNHGLCTDQINAFSCACVPGYEGDVCDATSLYCLSSPCGAGTCIEAHSSQSFECTCPTGLQGALCTDVEYLCLSSPCANDGVCISSVVMHDEVSGVPVLNVTCECTQGYGGMYCTEMTSTSSSPPIHSESSSSSSSSISEIDYCVGNDCDTDTEECISYANNATYACIECLSCQTPVEITLVFTSLNDDTSASELATQLPELLAHATGSNADEFSVSFQEDENGNIAFTVTFLNSDGTSVNSIEDSISEDAAIRNAGDIQSVQALPVESDDENSSNTSTTDDDALIIIICIAALAFVMGLSVAWYMQKQQQQNGLNGKQVSYAMPA